MTCSTGVRLRASRIAVAGLAVLATVGSAGTAYAAGGNRPADNALASAELVPICHNGIEIWVSPEAAATGHTTGHDDTGSTGCPTAGSAGPGGPAGPGDSGAAPPEGAGTGAGSGAGPGGGAGAGAGGGSRGSTGGSSEADPPAGGGGSLEGPAVGAGADPEGASVGGAPTGAAGGVGSAGSADAVGGSGGTTESDQAGPGGTAGDATAGSGVSVVVDGTSAPTPPVVEDAPAEPLTGEGIVKAEVVESRPALAPVVPVATGAGAVTGHGKGARTHGGRGHESSSAGDTGTGGDAGGETTGPDDRVRPEVEEADVIPEEILGAGATTVAPRVAPRVLPQTGMQPSLTLLGALGAGMLLAGTRLLRRRA